MRIKYIIAAILALLVLSVPCFSQTPLWSGIIDTTRATDWSKAGVVGGIPTRNTICFSVAPMGSAGSPAAPTTINNDIQSCTAGQVVFLQAGKFYLNGGIDFHAKNGVTVRGAGANSTFIYFTGTSGCNGNGGAVFCIGTYGIVYSGGWGEAANWTAGYAQNSNSLTLVAVSDGTSLVPGNIIVLDQCNTGLSGNASVGGTNDPGCHTGTQTDNGNYFVCDVTSQCTNGGGAVGNNRTGRGNSETHIIASVSPAGHVGVGTYTVTLDRGIELPNWTSGSSPGAWWPDVPNGQVTGDGVENLSFENENSSGSPDSVEFFWASNSWFTGNRSLNGHTTHIQLLTSVHNTIANNYFYGCANPGSGCYGISEQESSDDLIQNNMFQHMTGPIVPDGPISGSVYASDWAVDDAYGNAGGIGNVSTLLCSDEPHSVGVAFSLWEGNQGLCFNADDIHGTVGMLSLFRNWYSAQPIGMISQGPASPTQYWAFARDGNVIGNVLGIDATLYTNTYQSLAPVGSSYPSTPAAPIYWLGWLGFTGSDSLAYQTLYRWGNYDVKTANVRFCGNSSSPNWSNPLVCNSISEVPTGLSIYAQAVPSTTNLPASFYQNIGFFPNGGTGLLRRVCTNYPTCSTFTTPGYPDFGPDLVGGTAPGGHGHDNPAAVAWKTLPNDTTNIVTTPQATYTAPSATCSNVGTGNLVAMSVTSFAGNYPSGEITVTGFSPSAYNGTWLMNGDGSNTPATIHFYLPSGVSCPAASSMGGSVTYPHIRQYDASIFTLDAVGVSISPSTLPGGTVGVAYSQTLTATGGVSPYTWSVLTGSLPAGLALNTATGVISGTPTTVNSYSFTIKVTDSTGGTPLTGQQPYNVNVNNPPAPPAPCPQCLASATFNKMYSPQPGNWAGNYGADGYSIEAVATKLPGYAQLSSSAATWTWAASTTDARALSTLTGGREAACWYGGSFTMDVNLTDNAVHRVTLYLLDWDGMGGGRNETVSVNDAVSGALLNSQTVSNFGNGVYVSWNCTGHVKFTVTSKNPAANAVVSGIFFG